MHTGEGLPFTEGRIPFQIPSVDKECFTYYRVYGDLNCGRKPLVCLHGGPGGGMGPILIFTALWPEYKIPLILYDQIGCGESTNLDKEKSGDQSFWQMSLFLAELDNLIKHFNLHESGFDLLGGSFGAMLAADYAASCPRGLNQLVLGSPISSTDLFIEGIHYRKDQLAPHHRDALNDAVKNREFSTQAYKDAYRAYWRHCMCRADPLPPLVDEAIDHYSASGSMLENTMWGPSPMTVHEAPGSLHGWTVIPRLHLITAPTLLWNSEYDQSHDGNLIPMFERIPRVRWFQFANASHVLFFESEELRQGCIKLVGDFLL